jgi:hypothetical protein
MEILLLFKLKNHLIQLYGTYKLFIQYWLLLKVVWNTTATNYSGTFFCFWKNKVHNALFKKS